VGKPYDDGGVIHSFCYRPFNNYVDKKRGGGQKMPVFVHAGGGGSKNYDDGGVIDSFC
jgi:hypothetical protein